MERVQISRFAQASPFHGGMQAALIRVLITGLAVFLAVAIVPGIEASTLTAGVAAVLVLTFLNLILRPILLILTLPLIILSLGLFLVVVNALLLEFTAYLVKDFTVSGFWPAVGGALVISIVTSILSVRRLDPPPVEQVIVERRAPKIINPD
ncbi:MAG: Phage holin family protein [Nitrospira sp.]|nr:MAG: Phage holin family protein [Nitrospira sp.]